jgi:hypothetical protein
MPKVNSSKRTRRIRNRVTVYHDDEPCDDEGGRDITASRTTTGRIVHSTTLASKLETGTSINGDFADPWTTGFFDCNTEAFVVDSPPAWTPDEFLDSDPLESQPEPKDKRMVRMSFTFECSHIDKDS